MRALENEKEFSKFLLDLGDGKLNDENDEVIIPNECVRYSDLVEEIFGEVIDRKDFKELSNRAILAPLNIDVDTINDQVLFLINEEESLQKYRHVR